MPEASFLHSSKTSPMNEFPPLADKSAGFLNSDDGRRSLILSGPPYWRELVNFDALVRHGTIDQSDLELLDVADDPATAPAILCTSASTIASRSVDGPREGSR